MFTTYVNKYYAPLYCGGLGSPRPLAPFGYGPAGKPDNLLSLYIYIGAKDDGSGAIRRANL